MSLLVILRHTVTELCASLPAAPVFRSFLQCLVIYCSKGEAASDVISDRLGRVNFRDSRLSRSAEIPNEAVGGGIFEGFS